MRKQSSTNLENQEILHERCDAAYTLSLISGRWKLSILTKVAEGINTYAQLKVLLNPITERILALQLKELSQSGLLVKLTDQNHTILYELTAAGKKLMPIINSLGEWGIENKHSYTK